METYGTIKVVNEGEEKQLSIVDYTRFEFKDKRFVTILETELKTYVVGIENLPSSGRCIEQKMHLTEESMIGIVTAIITHLDLKNIDAAQLFKKAVNNKDVINYETTIHHEPENV